MQFTFESQIKESKGALNTAAKIADILAKSEVSFSSLKGDPIPAIFVKFPGNEKFTFIAHLDRGPCFDDAITCEKYTNGPLDWWTAYSKRPYDWIEENYLFPHLTDAAEKLVDKWVMSLCDEYAHRIQSDTQNEQ